MASPLRHDDSLHQVIGEFKERFNVVAATRPSFHTIGDMLISSFLYDRMSTMGSVPGARNPANKTAGSIASAMAQMALANQQQHRVIGAEEVE